MMGTIFKINSAVLATPKATALALKQVPATSLWAFLPELNILGEALKVSGVSNADQFIHALSELEKAISHPINLEDLQRKMLAVVEGIDNPGLWERVRVQVETLQRNTRRFASSGSIAIVFRQKSAAPKVATINTTAPAKQVPKEKLLSAKDVLKLTNVIAMGMMEKPELADAEVIGYLEQAVYQAQKMGQQANNYMFGLASVARHHPNENIRALADSSLGRIEDFLQTNLDALASLELDMDQLWKNLEETVATKEKDLLKIDELALLIIMGSHKKREEDFHAQIDKLFLHPSPAIRNAGLSVSVRFTRDNNMIPYFWVQQKPLIKRDLISSKEGIIWEACAELAQFVQWGVEEAIEMFSDPANSKNPIIQRYLKAYQEVAEEEIKRVKGK